MQEEIKKIVALGESQEPQEKSSDYDYSKFFKDGFERDDELVSKFQGVAKKLNLSQESVEMLLEIALLMINKQKALYDESNKNIFERTVSYYDKLFKEDESLPDINSKDIMSYMKTANIAYEAFCSLKLKEFFKTTALNYHPEFIKMFHKIGELMEADGINYDGKPKQEELTPAQILYGKRELVQ